MGNVENEVRLHPLQVLDPGDVVKDHRNLALRLKIGGAAKKNPRIELDFFSTVRPGIADLFYELVKLRLSEYLPIIFTLQRDVRSDPFKALIAQKHAVI